MHAYRSAAASVLQTTNFALPVARPKVIQQPFCQRSGKWERLLVKATTLKDLTLERTQQRTLAEPAAEDTLQHPSQVPDHRQPLQEYAHPLTLIACISKTPSQLSTLCRCDPSHAPLKVAVLLSGGVDSSCALHLLKEAGHHVTAFYLQIWFQEDFRNYWDQCPWEDDLDYCQQVQHACPALQANV